MVKLQLARGHPPVSTCIEVGGGEQIGEGVIVSSHNKWLVDEILFKVVHNSPLESEELSFT